jgi:hypothetical protein
MKGAGGVEVDEEQQLVVKSERLLILSHHVTGVVTLAQNIASLRNLHVRPGNLRPPHSKRNLTSLICSLISSSECTIN